MRPPRNISRHAIRNLATLLIALLAASMAFGSALASAASLGGSSHHAGVAQARALTPTKATTHKEKSSSSTPRSAPEPATDPNLLFYSDFSNGLDGWSLGGVGEVIPKVISSPEGNYAEFTLTGSQGRSELIMGNDLHIVEGETVLYEFEEFIVPGFAYGSKSLGWNLFTQFKSDGEGSPLLALDLWSENGKTGLWVEPDPDPVYYVSPMAEGVWHRVSLQITGSSQNAGGWILKLDGQEVDRRTGRNTIKPGKSFAYIKNGLYRSGPTINATSKLRMRNASLRLVG